MKRLLLSITAVLAVGFTSTAQTEIYHATDSAHFAMWTPYDIDGDGNNWEATDITGLGTSLDGQGGAMMSESYINGVGALTPDNLMISPAINCAAFPNVFLTWGAGSNETAASTYHDEYYAVYLVSNIATLLTGTYPTPVWEGALTTGQAMEWNSVDVSAMAGSQGTVHVVIRHFNCTDNFRLWVDGVQLTTNMLGLEEATIEASVYPNPTNSILNVQTTGAANSISIISMDGKVVSTSEMSGFAGTIDVSNLTEGVYFYEVSADNGAVVRNTFVKK